MENSNESKSLNEKDSLYLLSFMDTSDRLDILLLEIRHLQQSIIDSLHAPTLYLPLRFEEKLIFGGWVTQENWDKRDVATIASRSIVRYPEPIEASRTYYRSNERSNNKDICGDAFTDDLLLQDDRTKDEYIEKWQEVRRNLCKRIGEIWAGDLWARGERRNYYALCELQLLKQQIFKDKVSLYKNAKRANILCLISAKRKLKRPAFMILKRGVLYRVERYISILRTHQQSFGKSLDFGLLRYPRPSIERRREIGIFNDFLANRTRDIQHDMLHLLCSAIGKKSSVMNKHNIPNVMHGWSQFSKVRSTQLYDDVARDACDHKGDTYQDVSYIDTSIWSPDRPDLQPLVAREVAKTIIRSHLENLNEKYLSDSNDNLAKLVVDLSKTMVDNLAGVKGLEPILDNHNELLRFIVQDLLATSIKGSAYVYALYLDIIGEGLEDQLHSQKGIRLDIAYDLTSGVSSYNEHYLWYFRLQLVSAWLQYILVDKSTNLDEIVFNGVEQISDRLLSFLDENTPHVRIAVGRSWQRLCKKLKLNLANSHFLSEVKKWRLNRLTDTWNDENCEGQSGKKEYHRAIMPLDIRVQNYLFRQIIHQKRQYNKIDTQVGYKLLSGIKDSELTGTVKDEYGLSSEWLGIPHIEQKDKEKEESHYLHPRYFFRYLYDIPYQAALLRSMDLLKGEKWRKEVDYWESFTKQMHEDIVLGRDIFSFGLEFYTWRRDSPKDRLLTCINLLTFCLPSFIRTNSINRNGEAHELKVKLVNFCQDVSKQLIEWLYAEELSINDLHDNNTLKLKNIEHSIHQIMLFIENNNHKKVQKKNTGQKGGCLKNNAYVHEFGAVHFMATFSGMKTKNAKNIRRLEQLCGYKLKALLNILNNIWSAHDELKRLTNRDDEQLRGSSISHIIDSILQLGNLRNYLQIRDEKFYKKPDESSDASLSSEHYFYELLLKAFGDSDTWYKKDERDDEKITWAMPKELQPVMVSRLSATSYYEVASSLEVKKEPVDKNKHPQNAFSLYEVLAKKEGGWVANVDTNHPYAKTIYTNTIGRYDFIGFTPVHLPCKCSIASFKKEQVDKMWEERFVSHFSRREVALPLKIYGNTVKLSDQTKNHCDFFTEDYKILTILSISLQRRAMRLNLVFRLLHAVRLLQENKEDHFAQSSAERHLQEMIKAANKEGKDDKQEGKTPLVIKALLTDGWGDLVLVFMYEKADKLDNKNVLIKQGAFLEHFFELQNSLYEDFMVDRTEMIYTPACFDAIMYYNSQCIDQSEKCTAYRFYILIRFQEDRKMERLIENFSKAIEKKSSKKPSWMKDIKVFDMPGMFDCRIYFRVNYKKFVEDNCDEPFYMQLLNWLEEVDKNDSEWFWYRNLLSVVDKFETGIERLNSREGHYETSL